MSKTENKYEAIIQALTKLNYTQEDIDEIIRLEKEFDAECKSIEEACEEEGYPSNGSNYELVVADSRKWYDEQEEYIHAKYESEN